MTSLITTTEAQAMGVGLALSAAQLQTIIDQEEAEIVRRFGANYTGVAVPETAHGGGVSLYLKRQITSVSAVTEYLYIGDTAPRTLAAVDYEIWTEEGRLERLWTGTTGAGKWGAKVVVSYIPADDTDLRKAVLTALVQIAIQSVAPSGSGGSVSGLGYSITGARTATNWQALRGDQYARLGWLSR